MQRVNTSSYPQRRSLVRLSLLLGSILSYQPSVALADTSLIWDQGNWDEAVWAAESTIIDSDNDGVIDTEDDFPNNTAIAVDTDGDGLADAYVDTCDAVCRNTSGVVIDDDDDNDGILDVDDTLPLDPTNAVSRPSVQGELIAPLGNDIATPVLFAFDASTQSYAVTPISSTNTITFTGEYRKVWLYQLPDMDGNGAHEYGLFGIRSDAGNEEKLQFFIRDSVTGQRVSVLNWVSNWSQVSLVILPDVTGDGIVDVGMQGFFKEGYRPQLFVKNGLTGANHQTFSFPNLWNNPRYVGFSDTTGDGVKDVALFGEIKRNNKPQIKVIDGTNRNNRLKAYTFPDNWDSVSLHNVGDYNQDGEDDWGLLGQASADGRWQLIIKDGTNPKGALSIYAWPDMGEVKLMFLADANGDGVKELALGGLNTRGRWQLQIKDGQDRNNTIKNITWPDLRSETSLHNVGDTDGDGKDEVALLGKANNGHYELAIKLSSSDYSTESLLDLGSDWATTPTISQFDSNGDGIAEWLVWGLNKNADVTMITIEL